MALSCTALVHYPNVMAALVTLASNLWREQMALSSWKRDLIQRTRRHFAAEEDILKAKGCPKYEQRFAIHLKEIS